MNDATGQRWLAVRAGRHDQEPQLSATELLSAHLDRIAAANPTVNAMVVPDPERLLRSRGS